MCELGEMCAVCELGEMCAVCELGEMCAVCELGEMCVLHHVVVGSISRQSNTLAKSYLI